MIASHDASSKFASLGPSKSILFDLQYEYIDQSRVGDHICYITDNSKIQKSVNWEPKISIQQMIKNIIDENM